MPSRKKQFNPVNNYEKGLSDLNHDRHKWYSNMQIYVSAQIDANHEKAQQPQKCGLDLSYNIKAPFSS